VSDFAKERAELHTVKCPKCQDDIIAEFANEH